MLISNGYLRSTGSNKDCIANAEAGLVVTQSRLIGTGTGLAVKGGSVSMEISSCRLRMPTGDVAGSSVSATITNAAASPLNVELLAATLK